MKDLKQIQQEVGSWAREQFGDNKSKDVESPTFNMPLGSLPAYLGMAEEVGELGHVIVYRHQGRGFANYDEAQAAKKDALADILIFMCDFATRENIDLIEALNETWNKVCKRRQASWLKDKANEVQVPTTEERPTPSTPFTSPSVTLGPPTLKPIDEKVGKKFLSIKASGPYDSIEQYRESMIAMGRHPGKSYNRLCSRCRCVTIHDNDSQDICHGCYDDIKQIKREGLETISITTEDMKG